MNLYELATWLEYAFAPFSEVDGYLFFTGRDETREKLIERIAAHSSTAEAQRWMNIVLFDRFLDRACGDTWESTDPAAKSILSTIRRAWDLQIRSSYPSAEFVIQDYIDDDAGDFGLRVRSTRIATQESL